MKHNKMAKDSDSIIKNQKNSGDHDTRTKLQTKVVIRHLPPTMSEEEFLKQTEPLPAYDFYYYATADWSLGSEATCRAYITFRNYEDIFLFRDRFDGYVFVDNKGNEFPAIVEFAPFQHVLKNKSRGGDNKVNTIEQEPHYQQFLKKLEEGREALSKSKDHTLEFSLDRKKEEVCSTPLLQYLANKKEKRQEECKKRAQEKKRLREEEQNKNICQITGTEGSIDNKNNDEYKSNKDMNNDTNSARKQNENEKNNDGKIKCARRSERNKRRVEEYKKRLEDRKDLLQKGEKKERKRNRKDRDNVKSSIQVKPEASTSEPVKHIEIMKKPLEQLNDSLRINQTVHNTNVKKEGDCRLNTQISSKIKSEKSNSVTTLNASCQIQEKIQPNLECNEFENNKNRNKLSKNDDKREEKRIRNKDRPSIVIYQPKGMLRLSEETESAKDTRSQSLSDGENGNVANNNHNKIDEMKQQSKSHSSYDQQNYSSQHSQNDVNQKRVQRYSERTRNRHKFSNYGNCKKDAFKNKDRESKN